MSPLSRRTVSRRALLRAGLVVPSIGLLAACRADETTRSRLVTPDGDEVGPAEAERNPGTLREVRLTATEGPVDLGGTIVTTWTYAGILPGAAVRITAGDVLHATVHNGLPADTTTHWHGIALRNDADGVPDLTQMPITPGRTSPTSSRWPNPARSGCTRTSASIWIGPVRAAHRRRPARTTRLRR